MSTVAVKGLTILFVEADDDDEDFYDAVDDDEKFSFKSTLFASEAATHRSLSVCLSVSVCVGGWRVV